MSKKVLTHFKKYGVEPTKEHKDQNGRIVAWTFDLPNDGSWKFRLPTPKFSKKKKNENNNNEDSENS